MLPKLDKANNSNILINMFATILLAIILVSFAGESENGSNISFQRKTTRKRPSSLLGKEKKKSPKFCWLSITLHDIALITTTIANKVK